MSATGLPTRSASEWQRHPARVHRSHAQSQASCPRLAPAAHNTIRRAPRLAPSITPAADNHQHAAPASGNVNSLSTTLNQGASAISTQHAKPGEVISLLLGPSIAHSKTTSLAKTADLELLRLVLPAGKEIPLHKAPGEITVQCLEGRIAFTAEGKTQELTAGQLLYLAAREPHAVKAIEDASILITILLPKK